MGEVKIDYRLDPYTRLPTQILPKHGEFDTQYNEYSQPLPIDQPLPDQQNTHIDIIEFDTKTGICNIDMTSYYTASTYAEGELTNYIGYTIKFYKHNKRWFISVETHAYNLDDMKEIAYRICDLFDAM
jgi:hypothetical protein